MSTFKIGIINLFSDVPAITADEWWDGKNAEPVLVSMSEIGGQVKKVTKSNPHLDISLLDCSFLDK